MLNDIGWDGRLRRGEEVRLAHKHSSVKMESHKSLVRG